MAKHKTNSLGFPLVFNGPGTVEEFDQKAGRVGAALEGAIDDELYRGTLPEWQAEFAKEVEKLTGVPRGVDQPATDRVRARSKNPDKINDVPEKVKTYVNRATAGMSEADKKALAALAQEVANRIEIDPSPTRRQAGPKKDLLDKADSVLAGPEDQIQLKVSKYMEKVPGFDLDTDETGKPERTSFARLIGEYVTAVLAES